MVNLYNLMNADSMDINDTYPTGIHSPRHDFSHERISIASSEMIPHLNSSKKAISTMIEYKELMMMYSCAMKEIKTKFDVLNTEFEIRYQRNPINYMATLLKSTASILKKMEKKQLPFTIEHIENHVHDVAGVRVICSYVDDIYFIADALIRQNDIKLIKQKDYISHPKSNGYRSLHLVVSIPVFFAEHQKQITVEVQIRTIAMDFWASLEHQLRYKHRHPEEDELTKQLKECSDVISDVDSRMHNLRLRCTGI
ncbi:GTP pyrophosphokinase [Gorillibacterium timonense]|uniref:GTP pyrophosphokinase n=1 Tax=Gorillibacterium timonense TaxID=1689269 RepID=UPI000A9EA8D9|nr:GTP pyrophosphokinase family protein [Gorillibacterium timonense]